MAKNPTVRIISTISARIRLVPPFPALGRDPAARVHTQEAKLSERYADMEALRGFAAFGVVVYHFFHGFTPPASHPMNTGLTSLLVVDRPALLSVINGPFMVAIFFVLSSFVLTSRLVTTENRHAAMVAMLKRFPRLLPLTVIGTLVPAILFASGLLRNDELATLINSPWLERSGGVKVSANWPLPSISGSIIDSVKLYKTGLSQYNSALWTMKYELIGSLFALLTALIIGSQARIRLDAAVVFVLGAIGLWFHPLVATCVATVFLTKYVARPGFELKKAWTYVMLVGGLVLGSTYESLPEELLVTDWARTQAMRLDWLLHGAGAMLVFLAVRGSPWLRLERLAIGRHLGRLSFPMYVLHVPVLGSVGCAVVLTIGYNPGSLALSLLATISVLLLASMLVARCDEWWVGRLNMLARGLTSRQRDLPPGSGDPAP